MKADRQKLLVAGGGYADIPLILSAKRLGYYVITSGNRPEELGHLYADEYQPADFSDPDAILALAKRLKIAAVCASCNDFSALAAAYTAEKLGLQGHDSYRISQIIHHKDHYRAFAAKNGITTPAARGFSSKEYAIASLHSSVFPVIVKPVDLTGGKGVSVVRRSDELGVAINKAFAISRGKRIVVEEFVEGSRHGFSAFLVKGRVVFFFSDNEHYFLNPFMVSAASVPGNVSAAVVRKLCSESEKIAALLSLKDGIFHIQYILRQEEEPVIIEICRRAPGDLYIKFVEHATGVDYPSWIVKASAGLDCSELVHVEPKGFFTRHCIMSASPGKVKDVVIDAAIEKKIIDRLIWWKKGDVVADVMTTKFGIVFLRFSSQDEMLERTGRMQELIRVVTE